MLELLLLEARWAYLKVLEVEEDTTLPSWARSLLTFAIQKPNGDIEWHAKLVHVICKRGEVVFPDMYVADQGGVAFV